MGPISCVSKENYQTEIRTLNYIKTSPTTFLILIYCHILLDFVAGNSNKLQNLENKISCTLNFCVLWYKENFNSENVKKGKKRKRTYIYSFKIDSNHEQKR
jgi:hypothetical protein